MNIFNKTTVRFLKKNKTRTIMTIIGIILSAAMITGVTTFASSLQHFMKESAKENTGNWYATVESLNAKEKNSLVKEKGIAQAASFQALGYAKLKNPENDRTPYVFVAGFENDLYDMVPVKVTQGRLARNSSEIVLPERLSKINGSPVKIGRKISLKTGERMLNGEALTQTNGLSADDKGNSLETIKNTTIRTYTIVGICESTILDSGAAPGYGAITKADGGAGATYQTYLRTEKAGDIYDLIDKKVPNKSALYNDELLMFMGVSDNAGINGVLAGMSAIVIVLIMLGSISLIYNAFSISVGERTRQFGLLSSVGASGKQLRKSVVFEALFVSGIGVPIGILSGIAGIGVTLHFVGKLLKTTVEEGTQTVISLWVSPLAIIAAVVIAMITVLISAYIPAKRASRVSAIDAIRQTQDIKIKAEKIKSSKLTFRLFGLEGTLARKNFKRNRRKYRATVISLFLSVVLFISASAFSMYLSSGVSDAYGDVDNYDISYYSEKPESTKLFNQFSKAEGITESAMVTVESFTFQLPKREFSAEDLDLFQKSGMVENNKVNLAANVYALDEASFKKYAEAQGLPAAQYTDINQPKLAAYNKLNFYDSDNQRIKNIPLFEGGEQNPITLTYNQPEKTAKTYQVDLSGFTEEPPIGSGQYNEEAILVTSKSMAKAIFPGMKFGRSGISMYFKAANTDKTYEALNQICQEQGADKSALYSMAKDKEMTRNMLIVINIFAYGFIVLISLIAIVNVFNTISTNILLRRREFAMLRSVGMGPKGFRRMMNYECILYGLKALLYGLPVSVLVTYFIYRSMANGVDMAFTLPWASIGISILSVFIVVFTTMLYATRKIKAENTIDALKNENS